MAYKKFDLEKMKIMIYLFDSNLANLREIGKLFEVSTVTISNILGNKVYKDIERPVYKGDKLDRICRYDKKVLNSIIEKKNYEKEFFKNKSLDLNTLIEILNDYTDLNGKTPSKKVEKTPSKKVEKTPSKKVEKTPSKKLDKKREVKKSRRRIRRVKMDAPFEGIITDSENEGDVEDNTNSDDTSTTLLDVKEEDHLTTIRNKFDDYVKTFIADNSFNGLISFDYSIDVKITDDGKKFLRMMK